jgi:putative flippase GtrA
MTKIFDVIFVRYIINGIFATSINYLFLALLTQVFLLRPYAFGAFLACTVVTIISFFGNKNFVFNAEASGTKVQLIKFFALYFSFVILSTLLFRWFVDIKKYDFKIVFFLISLFQLFIGFSINKLNIFKQ